MPGPRFGFVKLLASSCSHCTKWADEQHRPAGFESRLVPDLPLPFIPTLIGLRGFDHVSSRVWWEAATNKQRSTRMLLGVCVWPFLSSSWVAFGRPSYLWAVLPGVPRNRRFPPATGGHPPRLLPPSGGVGGWVYCLAPEAPQKWECRLGRRYLWPCRTRMGFGLAIGPTLKTALCHIRALVGRIDKYRGLRGRSQGPLGSGPTLSRLHPPHRHI